MAAVSFAVDVSSHQDSSQPWRAWGIHLGFAKATEGEHTTDAWFRTHIAGIKGAALIPGAYHFAWPSQSAAAEAAHYISVVSHEAGPGFVHALDLERYPNGARNYAGVSSAEIRQYAHDWIARVKGEFPGQRVGIYTSGDDILDGHLPGNEDFLWYPAYPVQGRTLAQGAAALRPAPSGHTVWGWQFTSVPRDQTVIYMSPAALRAWAHSTTQEDDMPLSKDDIAAVAAAVWGAQFPSPTAPKGTPANRAASTYLRWSDQHHAELMARLGALGAAVSALARDGGLPLAQVQAAAEAGAKAALAELGHSLITDQTPED